MFIDFPMDFPKIQHAGPLFLFGKKMVPGQTKRASNSKQRPPIFQFSMELVSGTVPSVDLVSPAVRCVKISGWLASWKSLLFYNNRDASCMKRRLVLRKGVGWILLWCGHLLGPKEGLHSGPFPSMASWTIPKTCYSPDFASYTAPFRYINLIQIPGPPWLPIRLVSVQRHFYDVVEPKSSSLRQKPGKSDNDGSRTVEMSSMVQHCVWNSHITTDSQCNTVFTRFSASDCQFESFATLDMNYIHLSRSRLADGWDVGLSGSMRDNPKCPKMAGLKSNW